MERSSYALVKLIVSPVVLKQGKAIISIDLLDLFIFAAFNENTPAWYQIAGGPDDLEGIVQDFLRGDAGGGKAPVLQLLYVLPQLPNQNEVNRSHILESRCVFHLIFRHHFGNEGFMGQGKVCVYLELPLVKSLLVKNEVYSAPAPFKELAGAYPQKLLDIIISTAPKRVESVHQLTRAINLRRSRNQVA